MFRTQAPLVRRSVEGVRIVRSRWTRWGLSSGGAVLLALLGLWLSTGVGEVHRAHLPVNFRLADPVPGEEDWPWWRGPRQNGFVDQSQPPVRWSQSANVGWQARISGSGHSSPIVWDGRVYVAAADEKQDSLLLECFDRDSGRPLWTSTVQRGGFPPNGARGSPPFSTPACDGERMFLASDQAGKLTVTAVDLAGKLLWQREAGPYSSTWGYMASPVVSGSLVIVSGDQRGAPADRLRGASFLAALHRQTGEIIWRILRPAGDSYGTPIVARIAGREQLVLPGRRGVTAYNPADGAMLWTCRWTADRPVGSVAFDEDCVYASIRYPNEQIVCIRADGSGDVTASHVIWRERRSASDLPSPLVCDSDLLILADDGVLTCLEKATGKARWKKRLQGRFSASPVAMGKYLYCVNEAGIVSVVDRTSRGELIAENQVGQGCFASPAISGNRLLFRTAQGLLLVQPPPSAPYVDAPKPERRRF